VSVEPGKKKNTFGITTLGRWGNGKKKGISRGENLLGKVDDCEESVDAKIGALLVWDRAY